MIQDNELSFTLRVILGVAGLGIAVVAINQAAGFICSVAFGLDRCDERQSTILLVTGKECPGLVGLCPDVAGHHTRGRRPGGNLDYCRGPVSRTAAHVCRGIG